MSAERKVDVMALCVCGDHAGGHIASLETGGLPRECTAPGCECKGFVFRPAERAPYVAPVLTRMTENMVIASKRILHAELDELAKVHANGSQLGLRELIARAGAIRIAWNTYKRACANAGLKP